MLITGGTGGLGALVARHLVVEHGAESLLLVSRSGLEAEGARELSAALGGLGCDVRVVACDVADRVQVERLLAGIPAERPLRWWFMRRACSRMVWSSRWTGGVFRG